MFIFVFCVEMLLYCMYFPAWPLGGTVVSNMLFGCCEIVWAWMASFVCLLNL